MPKYTVEKDLEKSARAYGYELRCSQKDSMNLAHAIQGMTVESAKKYLNEIIALRRPLPAIYHKKKRLHQKGIGPGSFPKKAAQYMLKVVENVQNNAEYKGFDIDKMKITHISAYQGRIVRGIMPRAHGRATDKNETTTDVEIILEEVE